MDDGLLNVRVLQKLRDNSLLRKQGFSTTIFITNTVYIISSEYYRHLVVNWHGPSTSRGLLQGNLKLIPRLITVMGYTT